MPILLYGSAVDYHRHVEGYQKGALVLELDAGDGAPRQRDSGARRQAGEIFGLDAARVRGVRPATSTAVAAPNATRIAAPTTTLRLHTLA